MVPPGDSSAGKQWRKLIRGSASQACVCRRTQTSLSVCSAHSSGAGAQQPACSTPATKGWQTSLSQHSSAWAGRRLKRRHQWPHLHSARAEQHSKPRRHVARRTGPNSVCQCSEGWQFPQLTRPTLLVLLAARYESRVRTSARLSKPLSRHAAYIPTQRMNTALQRVSAGVSTGRNRTMSADRESIKRSATHRVVMARPLNHTDTRVVRDACCDMLLLLFIQACCGCSNNPPQCQGWPAGR